MPLLGKLATGLFLAAGANAETIEFPAAGNVDIGSDTRTIDGLTVANGGTGVIVGDGGTLIYNGGNFAIGGTARNTEQNLDMSGLSNFVFDSPTAVFSVSGRATGGAANTTGVSTALVNLAAGSNIITAAQFGVGDTSRQVQGPATNQGTLRLGQVNEINADRIVIGANQASGTFNFQDGITDGTIRIRGTDGESAVRDWNIAVGSNSNYSGATGLVDVSAGILDAKVDNLTIATSLFGTNPATGTFSMGRGVLEANTILLGQRSSTSGAGNTTARMNLGGGGTVRANSIIMGNRTGTTGAVNSAINLNGAVLRAGSILAGAGNATRAINFNNGVLANYAEGENMTVNVPIVLAAAGTHTFQVDGAEALMTVSGLVSGANGTMVKAGNGVLTLTGNNTYSGTTTINEGLIRFQTGANLGTGRINLDGGGLQWAVGNTADISARFNDLGSNGAVLDTNGNNVTLASAMTGVEGQLVKRGDGVLTLTGDNTYTGTTWIEEGELVLGNGGTSGNLASDVVTNTRLTVNRSDDAMLAGAIVGSGELVQAGTGTLVLTGGASHTGGTFVNAGGLQLGDGGTSGSVSGTVTLAEGTVLSVNRADAMLLDSAIIGEGALAQIGEGTTVLDSDQTYSGGTTITAGALRLGNGGTTGSVIGDIHNDGMLEFNRADDIVLSNAVIGSGGLVQMGSGTLRIADDQLYTGATRVRAGSLIIDGSIQSDIWVEAAGLLSGNGIIHGNVVNAGELSPGELLGAGHDYGTLTIRGDYVGNDGLLVLHTFLDDDASPSSKLIIDGGNASGSTGVIVNNTRDVEGHTVGNGILVIATTNGGTTNADAFHLSNHLRNGALGYELFRADLHGLNPDNWYLRNSFVVPLPEPEDPVDPVVPVDPVDPIDPVVPVDPIDPIDPIDPVVPVDPIDPIDPVVPIDPVDPVDPVEPADPIGVELPLDPIDPDKPLDPGTYPIIGRELATYGVVQPIARELGLLSVGTARERGGSRMLDQSQGGQIAWARVSHRHIDNAYQAFVAPEARGDLSLLQVGSDIWQRTADDGSSVRFGGYLGHARSNIDVRGVFTNDDATGYIRDNTGKVELRATSAGLSWVYQGQRGGYLDAVVQGTRYSGSAKAGAVRLPTKGEGHIASLETGYPFVVPLANSTFVLEPQLQVIWQQVRFERGQDGAGDVDLGSTRGVSGRIGVRGAWQIDTAGGANWSPYVALNHWRDPRAQSSVTYAGRDQVPMLSGTGRTELTTGVDARLTQRVGVFASTGYQLSTSDADDQKRDSFNANLGVQLRW